MISDDDPLYASPVGTSPPSPGLATRAAVSARGGSGGNVLAAAIGAFLVGASIVGLLAWHGDLDRVLPRSTHLRTGAASAETTVAVPALETRLALLEDRFSRLDQQANAAAGNAGRAERLLVAQATRRAIERGQPLGYLADQLRLRFADGQPRAVETLIAFSQRPVTLSTLYARLDTLTPQIIGGPRNATVWSRVQGALSGLFTIRSDTQPVLRPDEKIDQVKLMLAEGQAGTAADTIARLPGGAVAADWGNDVRRLGAAQQALDVIESTAMNPAAQAQPAPGNTGSVTNQPG